MIDIEVQEVYDLIRRLNNMGGHFELSLECQQDLYSMTSPDIRSELKRLLQHQIRCIEARSYDKAMKGI